MSSANASAPGRLYAVGVGPGDPELLTLKAVRILQSVPVVCVPQSDTGGESYDLNIVRAYLDTTRQEIISLVVPPWGAKGAEASWRDAAQAIATRLEQGRDVAFITEGDPMLYSDFSPIEATLAEAHPHLPVEIVPGISSVLAAAASARAPLVTEGQRLAILPWVYGIDDLRDVTNAYDTVVLMEVSRGLLQALANLADLGLTRQTTYVRQATMPQERVVRNLRQLSEEDLDYFSLLIIRK